MYEGGYQNRVGKITLTRKKHDMKRKDFKFIPLSDHEVRTINGGSGDEHGCKCPDCAGGWIGRAIGYAIRFWATTDYRRAPLS